VENIALTRVYCRKQIVEINILIYFDFSSGRHQKNLRAAGGQSQASQKIQG